MTLYYFISWPIIRGNIIRAEQEEESKRAGNMTGNMNYVLRCPTKNVGKDHGH